ncbi:MAG: LysR family transcriptional regulator [Bombella apis]|nr:LysR family transcriptional regulator [Bombella apis]
MKLPDFEAWAIFAKVAEYGSFSQAAKELQLSPPTVSKAVSRLEQSLGVSLFSRNSRHMSITQAGHMVLERANRIFLEAELAEAEARGGKVQPSGLIKIAAPTIFGIRHISPILPSFLENYPEIDLMVNFSDSFVDLIAEGYDLVIRITRLADSALTARKLCTVRRLLVAAPSYAASLGGITHPRDLEGQKSFIYSNGVAPGMIRLMGEGVHKGEVYMLSQKARLQSDNVEGFLPALEAGLGFSLLPEFLVSDALKAGRLVGLLPGWHVEDVGLYLVTTGRALRPQRVTLLMEHLIRHFEAPSWRKGKAIET